MLGVKRIKHILPTGMPLTIVGEAVKDDIGDFRIQKPEKGPFYVSPKSLDQLISNLGKWSRYASMGLTVFGVLLIAKHAIDHFLERRGRRELQKKYVSDLSAYPQVARFVSLENYVHTKLTSVSCCCRVLDAAGSNGAHESVSDSTQKEGAVPDLCVFCLEQEYNAVFVACGVVICGAAPHAPPT